MVASPVVEMSGGLLAREKFSQIWHSWANVRCLGIVIYVIDITKDRIHLPCRCLDTRISINTAVGFFLNKKTRNTVPNAYNPNEKKNDL